MNEHDMNVVFSSKKSGGTDEWETPREFFDMLNKRFGFTLDPCASVNETSPKCEQFYTKEDDGLSKHWVGNVVYINPPYSEVDNWIKKAYHESRKNATCVLLIPARTDKKIFHETIMKYANEIMFVKGRLKFELNGEKIKDKKGTTMGAPFPSMVVVFNSWCGNFEPIKISSIGRE